MSMEEIFLKGGVSKGQTSKIRLLWEGLTEKKPP